jgi:hypothetical protein
MIPRNFLPQQSKGSMPAYIAGLMKFWRVRRDLLASLNTPTLPV